MDELNPDELERMLPARADRPARAFAMRRGDASLDVEPEPIRPWSAGEILDVSLDVFRERFLLLAGVCILLWFPLRALAPFVAPHTWLAVETPEAILAGSAMFVGWALVGGVLASLGSAVVMQHTLATLEGRELPVGRSFAVAGRRLFAFLVIAFVYQIVVTVGGACLIAPGVFLAWKFWVAKPALILEGVSMGTAIQRSFDLSTGTFWRWLAVAFTRMVFVSVLSFTVATPDDPTYRAILLDALPISSTALDVANVFVSSIVTGTLTALAAVVETIFYVDCRIRRDGYDLDRELDAIASAHGGAAGELAGGALS